MVSYQPGNDGYYAHCQSCGKLGPVRDTPQGAWDALLNEDYSNDTDVQLSDTGF